MTNLITICARGGSKGIPGKNIKLLGGKPLIYYTLKLAEKFAAQHKETVIYLSTDSKEIKEEVRALNFPLVNLDYDRPSKLATDSAGKMAVIKDVLHFAEEKHNRTFDNIIDLDVTSPLRNLEDLNEALQILEKDKEAYDIFSVNPANRNPYFNMVEHKSDEEYITLCKEGKFLTRQSAPKVYDVNASFYIFRRNFFIEDHKSPITEKTLIYVMPHTCFDLDHPIDFDFMSFLIENEKLDFNFTT